MGRRAQDRKARRLQRDLEAMHIQVQRLKDLGISSAQPALVSTDPDAVGYTLTCEGCGRTATVGFDPAGKAAYCSSCVMKS